MNKYITEFGNNLRDDRVFKYCRRWIIRGKLTARRGSWIILPSKTFVYVWWESWSRELTRKVAISLIVTNIFCRLKTRTEYSNLWLWLRCRNWSRHRRCSSACNSFTRAAWINGITIYKYVGSVEIYPKRKKGTLENMRRTPSFIFATEDVRVFWENGIEKCNLLDVKIERKT